MNIAKLEISGYRSIKEVKLSLSRINLLAGKNGVGKSNILVAIDKFSKIRNVTQDDFHPDFKIMTCCFDIHLTADELKELHALIKSSKQTLSKPVSDFLKYYYSTIEYRISFNKSNIKNPAYYLGYKKTTSWYSLFGHNASANINGQILDAFKKILHSHFYLITIGNSFANIEASEHNRIAESIMTQFTSGDASERAKYNKLRDCVAYITEGVGGEILPAKFDRATPNEKYRINYEVEKKLMLPISHSGDGTKRVSYIIYHIINSINNLIAIEEPEICMHPGAQKRLRKTLDELCDEFKKNILITSHSPIFLDGWSTANVTKIENQKGVTIAEQIKDREQIVSVASELGVQPGDAFVANGILWVEGPSDANIYKIFLSKIGIDLDESNILVLSGGGDTMQHIKIEDLIRLNKNFAVLLDSDKVEPNRHPAKWKKTLVDGCKQASGCGYITNRREIENYFSMRVVKNYFNSQTLPALSHYEDFDAYIKKYIAGRTYVKTRDASAIAKLMTRQEIETCADLYLALNEIKSMITSGKQ